MARRARIISFDFPMHVMNRGNNRQRLFTNEKEKSYFRYLLSKKMAQAGVHILHYCLMNNHIHLIVMLEPFADLSKFLKQVFLAYYSFYRIKHEYSGHLFQGRFKNIVIDTRSYLLQCGKYIELNPVRAKIVRHPSEYEHSSYDYYAEGRHDPLITRDPTFDLLGDSEEERRAAYRALVIDPKLVDSEKLRSHLYLGSEAFIETMEKRFGIKNVALRRGRPLKSKMNK